MDRLLEKLNSRYLKIFSWSPRSSRYWESTVVIHFLKVKRWRTLFANYDFVNSVKYDNHKQPKCLEAGCSVKKVYLKNWQNSLENICVGVFFLISCNSLCLFLAKLTVNHENLRLLCCTCPTSRKKALEKRRWIRFGFFLLFFLNLLKFRKSVKLFRHLLCACICLLGKSYEREHPLSTFASFSEKLTIFTPPPLSPPPCCTHVYVRIRV